ncbi:phosphoribosyltransferase [Fulvivirga sp. M361]|uniref:phosphoribosyltransferase family protein n=1 Tax=Fulvivirga sp. M361 TaxID=2594266 RepID=UPI00117B32B9|nr:phosphoribosyltransferase family protein [Fulvivirga sp. M361]TRX55600.1 phosphoribosyltransferase [Fulvivirga sp. M361]
MEEKSLILSDDQVRKKIKRIAFEIYENNFKEKELILAGIGSKGHKLAELLTQSLEEVTNIKITLIRINLDKFAPTQSEISLSCDIADLKNKAIILIDDVLSTGRTIAYSLKPFLGIRVKRIETAVLVNRSHTQFPISTNYTGYELATSIKEHVEVHLDEDQKVVYLM